MSDVIIIGGGIAGCSTALYLAREGVDVLMLERGEPNGHASGANAGSLHGQIQHRPFLRGGNAWVQKFLPALPFYLFSIDLWEEAAEALDTDIEFSRNGGIIVATDADEMRAIEAKSRFEEEAGLGTRVLDREALRSLAPYLADDVPGGAFCPVEGKASPLTAPPAFATAARMQGADIMSHCEVTAISRRGSGYVVTTSRGEFEAPHVVNAAGIEVDRIAGLLGAQLDILAFPIQLLVTEPLAPLVGHLVYSAQERLTLKQTRAGTLLIGGGWPARVDAQGRPQVLAESLGRNLAVALRVVPAIADALVVRSWAGIVNGTDDWLPIIGEMPGLPGFYVNYVPWMGFTGGPGGGRIIADMITGAPPSADFDLAPFAP